MLRNSIANAEAARGLEQQLIQAVVDCLRASPADEGTTAQRHHTKIIRRFRKALEETADKAVYVPRALCGDRRSPIARCGNAARSILAWVPSVICFSDACISRIEALRYADSGETSVTDGGDRVRVLGTRAVRRRVPVPLRQVAFRHTPPHARRNGQKKG